MLSVCPWVDRPRVGNTGFALMRTESFLNVLRSPKRDVDPDEYWARYCEVTPTYRQWLNAPRKYLIRLAAFNNVRRAIRRWPEHANGDLFWADRAVYFWPQFTIADVDTALKFAFEVAPRTCFEMNNGTLPFRCHAWSRYDRAFWEPYLLKAAVASR